MRHILAIMLLLSVLHSAFVLKSVEVTVGDLNKHNIVHVRESIQFLVTSEYEKSLYETGFNRDDLSFWANLTNLKEVKLHLNPAYVDIKDSEFALKPQPLKNCNYFTNVCQGELIIDYTAYPYYNATNGVIIPSSGVFTVEFPKPRTTRYSVNPSAFAFSSTDLGDPKLERNIYLSFNLPRGTVIPSDESLNPRPVSLSRAAFPLVTSEISWTDMILVKFTAVFEVEESLDQEVVAFFSDLFQLVGEQIRGNQGIPILLIIFILLGGYFYLQKFKGR